MAPVPANTSDNIVIETLNMLVSTNIPDSKDISLTSKMFVSSSPNAAKYNEYPYITASVKIKQNFLNYNDVLDFYFMKDVYLKYARVSGSTDGKPPEPEKKTDKKSYKEKLDAFELGNLNYNIKKMLRLLFVTYPVVGNIRNTTDSGYITKTSYINNMKYSYLSINSKTYTVSKITWINDKYNHWLTKQLVKHYKEFNAWQDGEERTIDTSIEEVDSQRIALIQNMRDSDTSKKTFASDIEKIGTYFMNLSNWTNRNQSLSAITIREAMGILYYHLIILQGLWKYGINRSPEKFKGDYPARIDTSDEFKKYIEKLDVAIKANNNDNKPEKQDMVERLTKIKDDKLNSLNIKTYNPIDSPEFMIETQRTSKIIIGSNLVSISSVVQALIKDLYENGEKKIILENNKQYLTDDKLIFGNDRYKNDNFKTLSGTFLKDVQLVKKNRNLLDTDKKDNAAIRKLIDSVQTVPTDIKSTDTFGIIYDNNNTTKPKYEIYVYIDLTDAKVTDENKDNLDLCAFRDKLLQIKFSQLTNQTGVLIQHDPLIKLIPKPKSASAAAPTQGGRRTTRRMYYVLDNGNNQTRKNNNSMVI